MILAVSGLETFCLNSQSRVKRVKGVLSEALNRAKGKGFIFATTQRPGIDNFARQYLHVIIVANDDFLEQCEVGIVVKSHQPHPRLDRLMASLEKIYLIDMLEENHHWIKNYDKH